MFGPEITFRAQPHGTFKFLFNGIICSAPGERNVKKGLRVNGSGLRGLSLRGLNLSPEP